MSEELENNKDIKMSELKKDALRPVVVISASLLLLSITLNNVGFKRVVDAYAKSWEYQIENQNTCDSPIVSLDMETIKEEIHIALEPYDNRLKEVEYLAHEKGIKK